MKYFKYVNNGFVAAVGRGNVGNITKSEYDQIISVISEKPEAPEGFDYALKDDLTWELVEIQPDPVIDDVSEIEALNILLGGAT